MGGLLESHILNEGMNRGQTDVSGASAILPASFKIIEEIPIKGTFKSSSVMSDGALPSRSFAN